MSRNLGETTCHFCDHDLVMTGPRRPIDQTDAGVYFNEYNGMIVRDAECPCCLAQYLAWVEPAPGGRQSQPSNFSTHYDLSFRTTFNDEPGERDLPRYCVERKMTYLRTGPWADRSYLLLGEYK